MVPQVGLTRLENFYLKNKSSIICLSILFGSYLTAPFGERAAFRRGDSNIIALNKYAKDSLIYSPCQGKNLLRSLNVYGWRSPSFSVSKPSGKYRILVVGGSTVFSIENANEDTWVYNLGRMFESDTMFAGRVEVINAGQSAYYSKKIADLLLEKGFKLNPDMVVYYEATNETLQVNLYWGDVDNRIAFFVYSTFNWMHLQLFYSSMLYTYLFEKIHFIQRLNPRHWRFDENLTGRYFRQVITECKENAVEFVYVRQVVDYPLEKNGRDLTDEATLRKVLTELYSVNLAECPENEIYAYYDEVQACTQRLANEIQTAICRLENVPVIDPLPVFEVERQKPVRLFTDICHKTCYAEKILAGTVYEGLSGILIEKVHH